MFALKFGGTSVGSGEAILQVADIVIQRGFDKGAQPVVVTSAMAGATDRLLEALQSAFQGQKNKVKESIILLRRQHVEAIEKTLSVKYQEPVLAYLDEQIKYLENLLFAIHIIGEISPASHDAVCAIGEKLSSRILTAVLEERGYPAAHADLAEAVQTKEKEANGAFFEIARQQIGKLISVHLKNKKIVVATGFLGKIPGGILKSVGRGYSDFTTALIGAALKAREIQIWKEVDGILTADPRIVPNAKLLKDISYEAAAELAYFGAKVIHPKTIWPAIKFKIPVRILNTFKPKNPGTLMVEKIKDDVPVRTFSNKKGVTLINITSYRMLMAYGFLAKIFAIFEKYQASVDIVSTSEVSVSLTISDATNLKFILAELKELGTVEVRKDKAIICIVGHGMKNQPGIAGRIFSLLGKNKISVEVISQGASEINISCVINEKDMIKAIQLLHAEFVEK